MCLANLQQRSGHIKPLPIKITCKWNHQWMATRAQIGSRRHCCHTDMRHHTHEHSGIFRMGPPVLAGLLNFTSTLCYKYLTDVAALPANIVAAVQMRLSQL